MSITQQMDEKIAEIQAELAPKFKYVEQFRQQYFKDTLIHGVLIAIVLVLVAFTGIDIGFVFALGVLASVYLGFRQHTYTRKVKEEAIKPMAELLELKYIPSGSYDILQQAKQANIVPSYNRGGVEDGFIGKVKETEFEFTEAHLKYESGSGKNKSVKRVFDGGLMRFKLPYHVNEDLLILTDKGMFNSLKNMTQKFSGMQHIALEDPRFEGIYQAYGTDQIEARRVLTPLFMDVLANLKERFDIKIANKSSGLSIGRKSCDIQMLFSGNTLLLSLNYKGDYFEPGLMYKSLDVDWISDMVEDFALMRFIASSLKVQQHNYAHTQVK